jgi:hypothetical protein
MPEMTSRERYARIFAHQEADRVPVIDGPWDATIERWQREGMLKEVSYVGSKILHSDKGVYRGEKTIWKNRRIVSHS